MAYQGIGKCRFYCNMMEFNGTTISLFRTLPVVPVPIVIGYMDLSFLEGMTDQSFIAVLGHNYSKANIESVDQGSLSSYRLWDSSNVITTYTDVANSNHISGSF